MKTPRLIALALFFPVSGLVAAEPLNAPWTKDQVKLFRPAVVTPPGHSTDKSPGAPPSDAIVFFDGKDLSNLKRSGKVKDPAIAKRTDDDPLWTVRDGYMEIPKGKGWVETREAVEGDCQWHIEWRTPSEVSGAGQGRGNSGVFITGYPEVQVLDSFKNDTYPDGQASALYKKSPPLVNASRGPGQWQTYDIICVREKKNEKGEVTQPSSITVLHNGIVTQFAVQTGGGVQAGTLKLQDHNNPVRYRNIWARKLSVPAVDAPPEAIRAANTLTLYNGKDLKNWRTDPEDLANHWKAQGNTIVGENADKKGSILWTKGEFTDFELELEYKTPSPDYDSGVFARATSHQVQIGVSRSLKKDLTGCIYAPKDKAGKYPAVSDKVKAVHKLGDWNHLHIIVQGKRIQTFLNGKEFVDYKAVTIPEKGPVGLQLHGGVHMKMIFRNIKLIQL